MLTLLAASPAGPAGPGGPGGPTNITLLSTYCLVAASPSLMGSGRLVERTLNWWSTSENCLLGIGLLQDGDADGWAGIEFDVHLIEVHLGD